MNNSIFHLVEPPERTEQDALARWLDVAVGVHGWAHVPNESRRGPRQGASLKRAGMKAGLPDVLIFARSRVDPCARGFAIELKRRHGGRASASQAEWIESLARNGWRTRVCHGADEAIEWLRKFGFGV